MKRFFIPTLTHNPRSIFADLDSFYRAFESAAANSGSNLANSESSSILPNFRIHEDDKMHNIEIDLPGVSDKDIDVSVKDNLLTVSATRKRETKDENGESIESVVAKYERSFTLGERIDTENIAAITRDGMLLLSLPISEEKDNTKKIEVNKHLENDVENN